MLATITSSIEEHKGNYKKAHIDDLMLETETIIDASVVYNFKSHTYTLCQHLP